jgi:hypothetical protein
MLLRQKRLLGFNDVGYVIDRSDDRLDFATLNVRNEIYEHVWL